MTARKSSAKTVQWEDGVREVPLDAAAQWTNEAGWGALDYWTTLRALGLAGLHRRLRETVGVARDVHPAGLRRKLDAGPVAVLTEDFAVKLVQVDGPSLDLKHRPIDGMFRHPLLEVRLHEVVTGERGDGERPRSADSVRGRVRASIRIGLHTAMRLCAPIRYG